MGLGVTPLKDISIPKCLENVPYFWSFTKKKEHLEKLEDNFVLHCDSAPAVQKNIEHLKQVILSHYSRIVLQVLNYIIFIFTDAITKLLQANERSCRVMAVHYKAKKWNVGHDEKIYLLQDGKIDLVASYHNLKSLKYKNTSENLLNLNKSSTNIDSELVSLFSKKTRMLLERALEQAKSSCSRKVEALKKIIDCSGKNILEQFAIVFAQKHNLYRDLVALQGMKGLSTQEAVLAEAAKLHVNTVELLQLGKNLPLNELQERINAVIRVIREERIGSVDRVFRKIIQSENLTHAIYSTSTRQLSDSTPAEQLVDGISVDVLTKPVDVTMISVEFSGLLKEGGLAEAVEGLIKAVKKKNPESTCRLIFPKYSTLPEKFQQLFKRTTPEVHMNGLGEKYEVYRIKDAGIEFLFIDHPSFVLTGERPSIYSATNDTDRVRFTIFTSFAADLLGDMQESGEINKDSIIHLHDSHVVGVLLKMVKDNREAWEKGETPRIIYTFHNNSRCAQGRIGSGSPYNYDPVIRGLQEAGIANESINLFVESTRLADAVSTVSPSFALEAQTLALGEGVAFAARDCAKIGKLVGIVNGSIPERWNPETDDQLKNWIDSVTQENVDLTYGPKTENILEKRWQAKSCLGRWVNKYFPEVVMDFSKPIVTFVGRFDSYQKGIDRLDESIEATLKKGGQFICMGSLEDPDATKELDRLQLKYKKGVLFIRDYKDPNGRYHYQQGSLDANSENAVAGIGSVVRASSDFILIPSRFEPCGLVQFEGWLFGSLAIASKTGGLADTVIPYDGNLDEFNGFHFLGKEDRKHSVSNVVGRALDLWTSISDEEKQKIISRVMNEGRKSSWTESPHGLSPVDKYLLLYESARINAENRTSSVEEHFSLDSYFRLYNELWLEGKKKASRAVQNEEEYLTLYYSNTLDSEALEYYYLSLPVGMRTQVPAPYGKGVDYKLYEHQGVIVDKSGKATFSIYSPSARSIHVHLRKEDGSRVVVPMTKDSQNIWSCHVETGVYVGMNYQFHVDGRACIDPVGLSTSVVEGESIPYSVVVDRNAYQWQDQAWMDVRVKNFDNKPMSTYECYLPTWKREEDGKLPSLRKLTGELVGHCQKNGFTHIEFMGLLDYPCEDSWGYQVSSFFAPDNRLGSLEDLKYLIDILHQNNIGVIVDWIPAHFAKDSWALSLNNTHDYKSYWSFLRHIAFRWGTHFFNYSKKHVRNFLISSAAYLIEELHVDALRVDAIRCILTSDNRIGRLFLESGKGRLFLQDLNAVIHREFPGVLTIAEDTSGSDKTTQASHLEGLGFDREWNMCWVNNMLKYFSTAPDKRKSIYNTLIHSIMGDNTHKMVLAISHDEVRKGKYSLLNKVDGLSIQNKYANVRAMLSFMMCLPGRKLMFAGSEFGTSVDWDTLIGQPKGLLDGKDIVDGQKIMAMVAHFNALYKNNPAFYESDDNAFNLEWIEKNDPNKQVCAYRRTSSDGSSFACLHNFLDTDVQYEVEIESPAGLIEVANTDDEKFGGTGKLNTNIQLGEVSSGRLKYLVTIPAFSSVVIQEHK
ncbi:MAG: glycogen/starch synthase [Chlamydiales bacterium]|nr:glycogen/starch synthase [Chlamydiales bacterium]